MKTKANITVGVIEKVKEYYVAKSLLGGMIKVDRLVKSDHFGDEIHVYYEDIKRFDRVFIDGVEFIPKKKEERNE